MRGRGGSRRLTAALFLLAVAFAPLPGRAGVVRAVDVKNVDFEPRGLGAVAGDTITWTWRSGSHSVTAYQGATFDQQLTGGAFSTYSHNYTGGLLLYYCKIHSQVTDGNCSGPMCGRITDAPPTVQPPAIQSPPNNSTQYSHAFDVWGTVNQQNIRKVRLKEGQATLGVANVMNQSWTQYVDLPNGSHTLTAIAIDAEGFESALSPPHVINIQSGEDSKPPVVVITSPKDASPTDPSSFPVVVTQMVGGLTIAGHVLDLDSPVASVTITITDLFDTTYPTDWVCSKCGSDKRILFLGRAFVPPGIYTISVKGVDAAGHQATATKTILQIR